MERSLPLIPCRSRLCACLQEQPSCFLSTPDGRSMEWGLPVHILRLHHRLSSDECAHCVSGIPFCSEMQGSRAEVIHGLKRRSAIEEQSDQRVLVFSRGDMQGRAPLDIGRFKRGPSIHQDGRHILSAPSRGEVQRSLPRTICNGDRNASIEQSLDLLDFPLLCREQEIIRRWAAGREHEQGKETDMQYSNSHDCRGDEVPLLERPSDCSPSHLADFAKKMGTYYEVVLLSRCFSAVRFVLTANGPNLCITSWSRVGAPAQSEEIWY